MKRPRERTATAGQLADETDRARRAIADAPRPPRYPPHVPDALREQLLDAELQRMLEAGR